MRYHKEELLDMVFSELNQNWQQQLPELQDAFEEVNFSKGELLSNNWGELYVVAEGAFGKYAKKQPQRYAMPGEPLLIPNFRHNYIFKALADTKTYLITKEQLYAINESNPKLFSLYQKLIGKHDQYLAFRTDLLDVPFLERCQMLLKKYPKIRSYINNGELSSFLNMSKESLRKLC